MPAGGRSSPPGIGERIWAAISGVTGIVVIRIPWPPDWPMGSP